MPRVKRGMHHVKRRKNILARTKGMMWGRKSKITLAQIAGIKAGVHAYVGRKLKKRNNRRLQQVQINAGARELNTTYSKLINNLKKRNIELNRKMLAYLAGNHKEVFKKIVQE